MTTSPARRRRPIAIVVAVALGAGGLAAACSPNTGSLGTVAPSIVPVASAGMALTPALSGSPIRVGAAFPTSGNAAGLAGQELLGVRIAADLVNADGGIAGRPVELDVRDLESAGDAPAVMASLRADGVAVVLGAYSSDLSIGASSAANAAGLVYWEAGAVADRLTGRGLPLVFRVGASGTNLGDNSAAFAASVLAPRLGLAPTALRLAVVSAVDDYAASVADAAVTAAAAAGVQVVDRESYNLAAPDWPTIIAGLKARHPDVIVLASHIPDGVAFRRAMLASGLRVKALIGTTMAECSPDFAGDLGPDAIGIFASDRPTGGFRPEALDPAARAVYGRLAAAWSREAPAATPGPGASEYGPAPSAAEYTLQGPDLTTATGPTEEGLSGFAAAWALFHDVLPAAAAHGTLDAPGIAEAARAVDLPTGSLPNGAGLRFSGDPAMLGQNVRAAAVIWQWQAVRTYAFVWPATYATGDVVDVPLTR